MELHMQSHRWESRQPDWAAGAVAGFGAGGVMMVLELLWSTLVSGGNPWLTSRMVAAMAMGWDVLQSNGYSLGIVMVALVIHYILGTVLGALLAAIIAPFRFDSSTGMSLLIGAAFGWLLYLFNFYVMVGAFSWFIPLRGWPTLVAHLIFGMVAAVVYRRLERPLENRRAENL